MGKLITTQANGLELSLFPWEDASAYVADVEAMLEETYVKPWLADEDLDLMTPDMDAIVNDPMYSAWLTEIEATRFWSGEPQASVCNWSFLDDEELPAYASNLEDEPGYQDRITLPWLF